MYSEYPRCVGKRGRPPLLLPLRGLARLGLPRAASLRRCVADLLSVRRYTLPWSKHEHCILIPQPAAC